MTTIRKVRLEGGPCHGRIVDIEGPRKEITVSWTDELVERNWGDDLRPRWVTVAVTEIASYRFTDEPGVFRWVPDQQGLGGLSEPWDDPYGPYQRKDGDDAADD